MSVPRSQDRPLSVPSRILLSTVDTRGESGAEENVMSPVEEYINGFDPPARTLLEGLRRLSRECAPGADEQLKWGQPAYVHPDGGIPFFFSGHKSHDNVIFILSIKEAFAAELSGFKTG